MRKLYVWLLVAAVLLSDIMCAVVAYYYCDILWGIQYAGYSAPASTALLFAIPFLVGIIVCVVLAVYLKRKAD